MVAAGCAREDSRLRQAAENFESLRATTAAIGEAWLVGDVSGTFASTALDQTFRMLDLQRTELTASPRSLVDPRGARLSRVGERLTRLGIAEGRPLRIPFADFTIRDAVRGGSGLRRDGGRDGGAAAPRDHQRDCGIIMSANTAAGLDERRHEVRVGCLLGRRVLAANNRSIGRLEEFRVEKRAGGWVVSEFLVGVGGLAERLGVGVKLLFGRRVGVRVARWDQLDIADPYHPRLTCPVEELREE